MQRATLFFLLVCLASACSPVFLSAQFDGLGQNAGNGNQGNRDGGGGPGNNNAAAGGNTAADFDSLMTLIETVVVPETWEALGGPSNMFPYPQGVYVDAKGTLREIEWPANAKTVAKMKSILVRPPNAGPVDSGDWKQPAKLRYTSLRRLNDALDRHPADKPESINCLAGLSEIRYVFLEADDIIIAGPVGGIDSFAGWHRDRKTGRTILRTDFFLTCLASALAKQPFGCTIDPSRQGLQRAAQVAMRVKRKSLPIASAGEQLVAALGMQQIEVFGTAGDSPIGYVMVEADRHMKQLALGVHPMPADADNYLDVIEKTISDGPPQNLLLRLWFTANQRAVRGTPDRSVFEIAGRPIRLSGQNERALASGQRGHVTNDRRTEMFVVEFNQHWNAIRDKYPIYGSLESIYSAASISELLMRMAKSQPQRELLATLASVNTSGDLLMPTPRQVQSIAVLHSFRHRQQRHHILIASGGVAVAPEHTLTASVRTYPVLASSPTPTESEPASQTRWWWDQE